MHRENGQVERYTRTLLNMLRTAVNHRKSEWAKELWQLQFILNLTKQKTTQTSALNHLIGHDSATPGNSGMCLPLKEEVLCVCLLLEKAVPCMCLLSEKRAPCVCSLSKIEVPCEAFPLIGEPLGQYTLTKIEKRYGGMHEINVCTNIALRGLASSIIYHTQDKFYQLKLLNGSIALIKISIKTTDKHIVPLTSFGSVLGTAANWCRFDSVRV
ncbi:unnamed protein product [Pieris macdunnoughi]|uniref:Uncharacterized protein n=1 Tax=Pieris macdunnoughi TaxID=345717 RepID=A0A821XEB9_9NEOP|nr:unnamed protein product [Pieris macdunnoughi]